MAEATLVDEILSQQRALVDERLIDAALTVPVKSDVTAMTAPLDFNSHPPISQPVCLGSIRLVRSHWMTDAEIKDRIRQQLLNGVQLSSVLPTAPGQGWRLTLCMARAHHCAACGGDNPHFEFKTSESRICLHDRCYWLWRDVETDR